VFSESSGLKKVMKYEARGQDIPLTAAVQTLLEAFLNKPMSFSVSLIPQISRLLSSSEGLLGFPNYQRLTLILLTWRIW